MEDEGQDRGSDKDSGQDSECESADEQHVLTSGEVTGLS